MNDKYRKLLDKTYDLEGLLLLALSRNELPRELSQRIEQKIALLLEDFKNEVGVASTQVSESKPEIAPPPIPESTQDHAPRPEPEPEPELTSETAPETAPVMPKEETSLQNELIRVNPDDDMDTDSTDRDLLDFDEEDQDEDDIDLDEFLKLDPEDEDDDEEDEDVEPEIESDQIPNRRPATLPDQPRPKRAVSPFSLSSPVLPQPSPANVKDDSSRFYSLEEERPQKSPGNPASQNKKPIREKLYEASRRAVNEINGTMTPPHIKPRVPGKPPVKGQNKKPTFTLNDRFLYTREIFEGNASAFKAAIEKITTFTNYNDAKNHFVKELGLKPNRKEADKAFLNMIKLYFG